MAGAILNKLDHWADRITDRIMWRFPLRWLMVPCDRPIVSFTFDDVPDTALTSGARILEQFGLRGTFYIAGGLEGRVEAGRQLISADGCRQLSDAGHEIGCHTFSHLKVPHHGVKVLATDLDRNADYLDAIDPPSGKKRNFAYPYNAGSVFSRRLFADRFSSCRAGGNHINRGRVSANFLYGVEIRKTENHLQYLTSWIDAVVAKPGWLIFFTHDMAMKPTAYGCTPEIFEHLITYTLDKGCTVLPVGDALAEFQKTRIQT